MGGVECALGGVLVLAPDIEVVRQTQRAGVIPRLLARERARAVIDVVGPFLALDRQAAIHLRRQRRTGDARHRHGFAHARLGGSETRIARLRGFDPLIELRIVIGAPPVGGRPLGVRVGGPDGVACVERGGFDSAVLRRDASGTGTAGDC